MEVVDDGIGISISWKGAVIVAPAAEAFSAHVARHLSQSPVPSGQADMIEEIQQIIGAFGEVSRLASNTIDEVHAAPNRKLSLSSLECGHSGSLLPGILRIAFGSL